MSNADGLGRMEALLRALGNPERDLNIIHVAGTNGKGSTCVMTASVLEEAGFKVGLYTSPHLETECERIQIWHKGGRRLIEQSRLDELREKVRAAGEGLTVFETYTAAAYLYFAEEAPDYVVLECGMGGLLDSTNTIERPLACVITQVGLDHTDELGSTIEEVALNKAGMIKEGVPVVSQTEDPRAKEAIRRAAAEKESLFIDVSDAMDDYSYLRPAMYGEYQKRNAVTAALAVKAAGISVTQEELERGIANAVLTGRFEILGRPGADDAGQIPRKYFIVDGAHNPDAVLALAEEYKAFAEANGITRTLIVFGCMQDKNSEKMAEILTSHLGGCGFLTVSIDYGRAESPKVLGAMIESAGLSCTVCGSIDEAFETAMKSDAECVLVLGSIYLAGDMRSMYKKTFQTVESN